MAFTSRPCFNREAVEATINHFRRHPEPALDRAADRRWQSPVIAELAKRARGRVLVLAHVKELVAQNHAKYCAHGLRRTSSPPGCNKKRAPAVGGVRQRSRWRNLPLFDGAFSPLIVDERHRISDDDSQYQQIIQHLQKTNSAIAAVGVDRHAVQAGQRLDLSVPLPRFHPRRQPVCFATASMSCRCAT